MLGRSSLISVQQALDILLDHLAGIKVHFDAVMTMIADTLYNMLALKLRGFEQCDAPKIYRNFVKGKAMVQVNTFLYDFVA